MSHKGTYRVSMGGGISARKPGKKVNTVLGPNTLIPNWATQANIDEWVKSGYAVQVSVQVSGDAQVKKSATKDLNTSPTPDAPGVTNVAGSETNMNIDETKGGKVEVTSGVQPQAASDEVDLEEVQVTGAEGKAEAEKQAADDAELDAEVAGDVEVLDADAEVAVPHGKWRVTTEQLDGKEVEELNAMIVERMNDEEKVGFEGVETVEEAVAFLGQDL